MHPGLIERFDRWESDSAEPAVVSVDALAAAGSNEFSDDSVKREDDGQVTIMKEAGRGLFRLQMARLGGARDARRAGVRQRGRLTESSRRCSSFELRPARDRGRTVLTLNS